MRSRKISGSSGCAKPTKRLSSPVEQRESANIRILGGVVMKKAEIVAKLAEEAKVTKKVAAAMLDSLVKTLQAGLKDGGKIRVDGLGTFVVVDRKARNGVNPQTRAKIKIPASKAPAFRAANALKEAVKEVPKKTGKKPK
jgi:DNA-binding protein HU-beta